MRASPGFLAAPLAAAALFLVAPAAMAGLTAQQRIDTIHEKNIANGQKIDASHMFNAPGATPQQKMQATQMAADAQVAWKACEDLLNG